MKSSTVLVLALLSVSSAFANESDPLVYSAPAGYLNEHAKIRLNSDRTAALFLNTGLILDSEPLSFSGRDCTHIATAKLVLCRPSATETGVVYEYEGETPDPSNAGPRETTVTSIAAETPFPGDFDPSNFESIQGIYSTLNSTPEASVTIDATAATVTIRNDEGDAYIVPLKLDSGCLVIPGFDEMVGGYFSAGKKKLCFSQISGVLNVFGLQADGSWVRIGHTGDPSGPTEDAFLFTADRAFETGSAGG